jgi:hypothetical protein
MHMHWLRVEPVIQEVPVNAVQYNNAGTFDGSSDLVFDSLTNTLTANKISNGIVTIESNTISGLTDPISGQQAATKNYVDNYTSLTITTVDTIGATTYSAASMINGIIYRNNQNICINNRYSSNRRSNYKLLQTPLLELP